VRTTPESRAKSLDFLQRVLEGATYEELATIARLSRSAVEKRVKDLDRDIRAEVGVPGLPRDGVVSVETMRRHRDAYLKSLPSYCAPRPQNPRNVHLTTTQHCALILDTYRKIFARARPSSLQTFHLNRYCIAGRIEKARKSSGACRTVSRTPARQRAARDCGGAASECLA